LTVTPALRTILPWFRLIVNGHACRTILQGQNSLRRRLSSAVSIHEPASSQRAARRRGFARSNGWAHPHTGFCRARLRPADRARCAHIPARPRTSSALSFFFFFFTPFFFPIPFFPQYSRFVKDGALSSDQRPLHLTPSLIRAQVFSRIITQMCRVATAPREGKGCSDCRPPSSFTGLLVIIHNQPDAFRRLCDRAFIRATLFCS